MNLTTYDDSEWLIRKRVRTLILIAFLGPAICFVLTMIDLLRSEEINAPDLPPSEIRELIHESDSKRGKAAEDLAVFVEWKAKTQDLVDICVAHFNYHRADKEFDQGIYLEGQRLRTGALSTQMELQKKVGEENLKKAQEAYLEEHPERAPKTISFAKLGWSFLIWWIFSGVCWSVLFFRRLKWNPLRIGMEFVTVRLPLGVFGWAFFRDLYLNGDPKEQIKYAAYALGMLLSCGMMGGVGKAQTSKQNSKGKDTSAFVDKHAVSDKPKSASPPEGWGYTLDLRNTSVGNGDQSQFVRFTAVKKDNGVLIETIATEKETAVGHTETVEAYPGFRLFNNKRLTLNGIAGGKLISATNSKLGTTVHNFRMLFGGQLFWNQGRWSLASPVNRFEIATASPPKDRSNFSHTHQLLFRVHPRWQIGEETSLLKPWGLGWQKTLGFMARLKLNAKTALEFGWFAQPDFINPNKEDHAFRTRAVLAW